jgi:hypothetical protein
VRDASRGGSGVGWRRRGLLEAADDAQVAVHQRVCQSTPNQPGAAARVSVRVNGPVSYAPWPTRSRAGEFRERKVSASGRAVSSESSRRYSAA